jgi:hypothetical protein
MTDIDKHARSLNMVVKRLIDQGQQGILTKGKSSVQFTPLYQLVRLAPISVENIIYLFYKTSYLSEEVNCSKPSPLLRLPWDQ